MFAHAEVIAVVIQQFLQAGPAHVGELDLGFLGGERGFAAFQKILFAGARGLDHLVHGAVAPWEMLARKAEGDVIDHLGFVEGVERLVIAARGDDGMGIRRRGFPPLTCFALFPLFFMTALNASVGRV